MPISIDRYISRILPSWKISGSIGRTTLSDTVPLHIPCIPREKTNRVSWVSQNEGGVRRRGRKYAHCGQVSVEMGFFLFPRRVLISRAKISRWDGSTSEVELRRRLSNIYLEV